MSPSRPSLRASERASSVGRQEPCVVARRPSRCDHEAHIGQIRHRADRRLGVEPPPDASPPQHHALRLADLGEELAQRPARARRRSRWHAEGHHAHRPGRGAAMDALELRLQHVALRIVGAQHDVRESQLEPAGGTRRSHSALAPAPPVHCHLELHRVVLVAHREQRAKRTQTEDVGRDARCDEHLVPQGLASDGAATSVDHADAGRPSPDPSPIATVTSWRTASSRASARPRISGPLMCSPSRP